MKSIQYLLSQYSVHVTINRGGIGPVLQFFKNNKMASLILKCRLLTTICATARPLILNSNSDCYITTVSSINLANSCCHHHSHSPDVIEPPHMSWYTTWLLNYMEFLLLLTKVSCPLAPVRERSLAWALHTFKTWSHVGKSHTFLPVYNIEQIRTYNRWADWTALLTLYYYWISPLYSVSPLSTASV